MEKQVLTSALEKLVGRVIQVYKGGPEAKVGTLVAVKPEYLTLSTIEGGVVYYKAEHIKCVCEDTKNQLNDGVNENVLIDVLEAEDFNGIMEQLKFQMVQIDRGGPDSKVGLLREVKSDFVTVLTEDDGPVFYNIRHIKSVSELVETNEANEENQMNQGNIQGDHTMADEINEQSTSLHNVLQNFMYSWVKINRGGPNSMEGMIVDVSEDFLNIVVDQDVMRVPTYHLKNISFGKKVLQQQKTQQSNNDNATDNKESENNKKYKAKSTNDQPRAIAYSFSSRTE